jgi:hypothetical protein
LFNRNLREQVEFLRKDISEFRKEVFRIDAAVAKQHLPLNALEREVRFLKAELEAVKLLLINSRRSFGKADLLETVEELIQLQSEPEVKEALIALKLELW